MVVALAVVAGLPLPLLPLQILFLNLVTDVLPAFALATGEGEDDVLRQPPRNPGEPLLGQAQWWFIAVYGALLTISTLASLLIGRYWLELHGDALVSVSFLTLAFAQLFHVFNMRGRSSGLFVNAVTRNAYVWIAVALCSALLLFAVYAPPLASALRLEAPDLEGWILVVVASVAPLLFGMTIGAISHLLRRGKVSASPS
jgi:Ca2+-transporting ATPase